MSGFDTAFDRLIGHEGGYVNHPADLGMETNWGISKRSYPNLDIKALTREDARQIYYRDFWVGGQMAQFNFAIAFQLFDQAVNHGIRNSKRMLQRAVRVQDDGIIGAKTVEAVRSRDLSDVLMLVVAQRLRFWAAIPGDVFDDGWMVRGATNLEYAAEDN